MIITVAGNKKEVAEGLTVAQLIIDEDVETPEYVTVSVTTNSLQAVLLRKPYSGTAMQLNFFISWEAVSNGIYKRTA